MRTPQTEEGTCYAKMLTKSLGDIDWNQDAVSIERLIRGLNPWPSAYTMWNGKTIKIWAADVIKDEAPANSLPCGGVALSDRHCLAVRTGDGLLSAWI